MHLLNRRIALTGSASLLLLLCGACGLPLSTDNEPPPPPVAVAPAPTPVAPAPAVVAPPEPQVSLAEQQSTKVSDFVDDCSNRFTSSLQRSRQRYLGWVSDSGPTGRERYISRGVSAISNPSRCRQAVDGLSTQTPPMPEFEAAAERYVAALETLYPVLSAANTYYERESYRDDGAARGRELHTSMVAGWAAFDEAVTALEGPLRQIEDDARSARLERMANDPAERSRYLVERTMGEARAITDVTAAMELRDRRLVTEDPSAFEAQVQLFQTHVDEMRAHHPAAPEPQVDLSRFKRQANELLTTALALMRRVRDETPFSRSELGRLGTSAGWMTDGSPDKLMNGYNDLVREYNSLRYRTRR